MLLWPCREPQGLRSLVTIAGPAAHAAGYYDAVSQECKLILIGNAAYRLKFATGIDIGMLYESEV